MVLARRVSAEGRTRAYVQGVGRRRPARARRPAGRLLRPARAPQAHGGVGAQLELLDGFCGAGHLRGAGGRGAHARCARRSASSRSCAGAPARGTATSTCWRSRSRRSRSWTRATRRSRALEAERERLRQVDGLRAAAAAGGRGDRARGRAPGAAALLAEAERLADGVAGADAELDALAERMRGAADRGRGPRRRAARATWRGSRPTPSGCTRSRSGSTATTGSSASTAARWPRCSSTPSAAGPSATGWRTPRWRSSRREAALRRGRRGAGRARRRSSRRRGRRRRRSWRERVLRGAGCAGDGGRRRSRSSSSRARSVGPSGAERVEFMLAPNPGVAAAPVRESASGGELSRVMLALMTVAGAGGVARRWCSTRSTPAWAARPRARWASACARSAPSARCSASPTCRRSRRWPSATSGSRSRPGGDVARARSSASSRPGWWRSCAGCSAPTPATRARAATPRSCWRPREPVPPELAIQADATQRRMPDNHSRTNTSFIFVTGGVVSSLGKGIAAASIGQLLVSRGLSVVDPEVRPLHQRRPGHDEPVPARRGVRDRGRRRDRPRPRPLRALHRRQRHARRPTSPPAPSTTRSSGASAAATTSAAPSR